MKKFYQCLIILTFFSSCSNEGTLSSDDSSVSNLGYILKPSEIPANIENDFDIAGQIHNEILYACYETNTRPTAIDAVLGLVEAKAAANPRFNLIRNSSYQNVSSDRVVHIANLKATAIDEVINGSGLSNGAKVSLRTFITSLLVVVNSQENYQPIYDFIIAYEAEAKINPLFNAKDREIILTTTSIARHSVYLKKKRPKKNTDPDWDWMTGNIIGSTEGAVNGTAQAITTGLAVGIFENTN